MDWDDLRHFLVTARTGSVTEAARQLGVSYTTVSRRISSLEEKLGASLFDRETGHWTLTPKGENTLASTEAIAEFAEEIERNASGGPDEISGFLRITAVRLAFDIYLMPALLEFQELYPSIQLELFVSEETLEVSSGRGVDFAFRGTPSPPEDLIGNKLATITFGIYANKQVFDAYHAGKPVSVITFAENDRSRADWIKEHFSNAPHTLRTNTIDISILACRQGFGVARLPCGFAEDDPELYRISEIDPGMEIDFWMLAHSKLRRTPRMQLFREFMLQRLSSLDSNGFLLANRPPRT